MSRDWTPRELWNVEKHMTEQGNSMRNSNYMFVNLVTGEKTPLISKEEKEIGLEYPVLSFLFDGWFHIYSSMTDKDVRNRVFCYLEKALVAIIAEDEGKPFNFPIESFQTVKLWYHGELDKNFYYRETNNELFTEYIWTIYQAILSTTNKTQN